MQNIVVSSFYKYIKIKDPENFQKENQEFCNSLKIKDKIIISKEGINGTVSGAKQQIEKYENELSGHKEFEDIKFKRTLSDEHPFRKAI